MILRYPGGKSRGSLHHRIVDHIAEHTHGLFAEPFFGGGGVTTGLLKIGVLEDIIICEKDDALRNLWTHIICNPSLLLRSVKRFVPSVDQFVKRKQRILDGKGSGFDALVVNRLSHGGRGVKAGPQGGFDQRGKYKIGCRWNAPGLVKGINHLHDLFGTVSVVVMPDYQVEADYYYMDPPYWEVGDQLYLHNFSTEDHFALRSWLDGRDFLLSYNNHPEVHKLYKGYNVITTGTAGNGGEKKNSELLIW